MQNKNYFIVISILSLLFVLSAGCSTQTTSSPSHTQTSEVIYITEVSTPALQTTPATSVPVPSPSPSDTPSTVSEKTVNSDDEVFLTTVADNNLVKRIDSLAVYGCDILEAGSINQLILSSKKPQNSTLLKARTYLISATTYCQAPEKASRDQSQTKEDLQKFSAQIKEYSNNVGSRFYALDKVLAAIAAIGTFNSATFSGQGDITIPFAMSESGLKTIKMEYGGDHNFVVKIGDDIIVNKIGSYSGEEIKSLPVGKNRLTVTATGPWTIEISNI